MSTGWTAPGAAGPGRLGTETRAFLPRSDVSTTAFDGAWPATIASARCITPATAPSP